MAELVKSLLHKYKDLSSDSQHPCISVTPVLRVDKERQIPVACWPGSLAKMVSPRFGERPCLKTYGEEQ